MHLKTNFTLSFLFSLFTFAPLPADFFCRHRRRYVSTPEDFPCSRAFATPSQSSKASSWLACTTNRLSSGCTSRRRTWWVNQRRSLSSELGASRWFFRTYSLMLQRQCTPKPRPPLRTFVSRFTPKRSKNTIGSNRPSQTTEHALCDVDLNLWPRLSNSSIVNLNHLQIRATCLHHIGCQFQSECI